MNDHDLVLKHIEAHGDLSIFQKHPFRWWIDTLDPCKQMRIDLHYVFSSWILKLFVFSLEMVLNMFMHLFTYYIYIHIHTYIYIYICVCTLLLILWHGCGSKCDAPLVAPAGVDLFSFTIFQMVAGTGFSANVLKNMWKMKLIHIPYHPISSHILPYHPISSHTTLLDQLSAMFFDTAKRWEPRPASGRVIDRPRLWLSGS